MSITSARDLANIEAAAAADPRYLVTVYSYRRYYDGIFPYNLLPYNLPGVSLDTDTVTTVIVTVIVWSLDQARTHSLTM